MTARAAQLLADLRAQGVVLQRDGDTLRLGAPRGVMTAAALQQVHALKRELLTVLPDTPDYATCSAQALLAV